MQSSGNERERLVSRRVWMDAGLCLAVGTCAIVYACSGGLLSESFAMAGAGACVLAFFLLLRAGTSIYRERRVSTDDFMDAWTLPKEDEWKLPSRLQFERWEGSEDGRLPSAFSLCALFCVGWAAGVGLELYDEKINWSLIFSWTVLLAGASYLVLRMTRSGDDRARATPLTLGRAGAFVGTREYWWGEPEDQLVRSIQLDAAREEIVLRGRMHAGLFSTPMVRLPLPTGTSARGREHVAALAAHLGLTPEPELAPNEWAAPSAHTLHR